MTKQNKLNVKDWLKIGILAATAIPFILVIFMKLGMHNSYLTMAVTGVAIVAAAYFLSWATESLQVVVSQAFALAILALVQVLPEYSFEVVLAWKQQIHFAIATMTGANRLLMGFGWPLIFFVAYIAARIKKQKFHEISLKRHQSVEVIFLLIPSLYSIVIILKQNINLFDSAVLIIVFVAYLILILRLPPEHNEEPIDGNSTSGKIVALKGLKKGVSISLLLLFGFVVVFFGADPFIESLKEVATKLGLDQFIFIQWFAPFLSEFPESLTAFIWASTIVLASMGLANLITSKINQWTLLIASIPIFYSISVGHTFAIPLDTVQIHELILTTAQTIYGAVCMFNMKFKLRHAILLLCLFLTQFFLPKTRIEIACIFTGLIFVELFLQRKEINVFKYFYRDVLKRNKS
ncbi:MAG: hypothetical protein FWF52_02740 [Candidatus Azobacteroides sp.]|nr:hypothetical protein [Candidatus Azobacteroides sp.]